MKKFPNIPFTLNEDSDIDLLKYLQREDSFSYLLGETRKKIRSLKIPKGEDFRSCHKELLVLWPKVLTDALLELKKSTPKEWGDKKGPIHPRSFFHKGSLGIKQLEGVIKGFAEFEGLLYGTSPERYRDHVAHSFRVWIVGQGLLRKGFRNDLSANPSTKQDHTTKEVYKMLPIEWECMWAIAALCHDIGYPLQAIDKINQRARDTFRVLGLTPTGDLRFTFSQQMMPFHDTIIKLIASKPVLKDESNKLYLTHLQNKYYLKLLKSFDNLDHGIVSALLISKALVYFLESDFSHDERKPLDPEDARQFVIRREILRAIAAHTCPDLYHLKFNTLSFLLYVVDELQSWGRPTFEESQRHSAGSGDISVEIKNFSRNKISILVTTPDTSWDKDKKEEIIKPLDKLHRMLRLAVGTPELSKRLVLVFTIRNRGGQRAQFTLKHGKIEKPKIVKVMKK